jgi:hypothetical protein
MTAETPGSTQARARPARWSAWLQLVLAALLLLLVSQALWLWQTWPVRELLQPSTSTAGPR